MFNFKEKSSVDMGVFAKEEDFLGKAAMKTETITIAGKNGSDIIEHGYDNFQSSLSDVTFLDEQIENSIGWLSGKGELIYRDKKTMIEFHDTYTVKKRRVPFSMGFTRSPFWYKLNDTYIEPELGKITNEGTAKSNPLIKLTKVLSPSCEFRVNGTQFKYTFTTENSVVIDCDEKNAHFNNLLRNRNLEIGFKFPELSVGDNTVVVISGDAKIEFMRKDVWL